MSKENSSCFFEYNTEARRYFSAKKGGNLFLANGLILSHPGFRFLAGIDSDSLGMASNQAVRFMWDSCKLCGLCQPLFKDTESGILIERREYRVSSPEKPVPLYEAASFVPTGQPRGKVCLIEDDQSIGQFLGNALSEQGYEVHFFWTIPQMREGGAECSPAQEQAFIRDILQRNPDVVISDMTLGGIFNSFAVLSTIKENADSAITTVMLSGGVHNTAESRGAADHYLTKPITSRGLLDFLNTIVVGR
jgi:CheY-like chemotaxis protein